MPSTRRDFLRYAAALSATAAFSSRRAGGATDDADIIVIGAGLSGLAAAMDLEQAGVKVLVLEAQGRVGGKVLTFAGVQGVPEAGASMIYGDYRRTIALASRLDVPLEDQAPRLASHAAFTLVLDGRPISREAWVDSPRNPFPSGYREMMPWQYVPLVTSQENPLTSIDGWFAAGNAPLDVSLEDFLRKQGATDAMIKLAYDTIPTYGMNAADVSALLLAFVSAYTANQRRTRPVMLQARGGNQRIPEAMAHKLRAEVRFDQVVTAIESTARGVEVRTREGKRYTACNAICALPFSTLRKIAVHPLLRGTQDRAVRSLPHQPVHQIVLHAARPFWEADGLEPSMWTDSNLGRVAAIYQENDPDAVSSLVVSAFGPAALALDRLGAQGAANYAVQQIESIRPAAKGALSVTAQHSWTLDPYALGAWAYFRPGTVTRFLPAMSEPHGRIHFCGEQTAHGARGMEGALESGSRAAREVFTRLS